MGNLGTGLHCEADVGSLQGGGIVGSITSDGYNISELFKAGNHDVLVIGSRSSEDLELVPDQLHVIFVSDSLFFWVLSEERHHLVVS